MQINLNIKLSHQKDSDYTINVDIDPERIPENKQSITTTAKTELGSVTRPSADRLRILKHPELKAEDTATEAIMDTLEL